MTSILLVSATSFETEPTLAYLKTARLNNIHVLPCITGVGMVNTAFELGRLSAQKFDLAINAGIAGSFGPLKKGEVVNVMQDCFAELGAENDTEFLSVDEMGFGRQNISVTLQPSNSVIDTLFKATGITVNTVHGNAASIAQLKKRCIADVETMEGAAFIHAANALGWPAIQLRAISNAVEKRNRANWDIALAIKNLNAVVIDLLNMLNEH